jgi:ABC-type bacteriocin/lantibiotic exporter with double-glycine peptidase domain
VTSLPRSRALQSAYTGSSIFKTIARGVIPESTRRKIFSVLQGYNQIRPAPLDPHTYRELTAWYREDILNLQGLIGIYPIGWPLRDRGLPFFHRVMTVMRSAWRYYLSLFRPDWLPFSFSLALSILQAFLVLPIAYLVQYAFDQVLPSGDIRRLLFCAGAVLLANLAVSGLSLAARRINLGISKHATLRLRSDLLHRLYSLPRAFHGASDQGKLHASLVQDTERVDAMGIALVSQFAPSIAVCLGLGAVLIRLNTLLFFVLVALAPLFLFSSQHIKTQILQTNQLFLNALRTYSKGIAFLLRMMDLTAMQSAEPYEIARQERHFADLRLRSTRLGWLNAVFMEAQTAIIALAGVVILVIGGLAVASHTMTIGALMSFYVSVALLSNYLKLVWGALPPCLSGSQSLDELYKLMRTTEIPPYVGRERIAFRGEIVFDRVTFQYQDVPILQDVSLTLPPQTMVGIVGPNGAGKTTLIHLLLGWYRPQAGCLRADGRPYDNLDIPFLRRSFGVVPQNPNVFDGTIWENIVYGSPDTAEEDILRACELATAREFIRELADGLQTRVGEGGMLLSGGQRQRIAIARALIRKPSLLILDEPTNHLDQEATGRLMENLRRLDFRPTIVMVSHHPNLVQHAKKVYAFEGSQLRQL